MGFHDRWISLIMECISTVSYSLLINGNPIGHITPTRGIRQGDPISPYLFLLCDEGLNGLIRKPHSEARFMGSPYAQEDQRLLTCFLQMTIFSFAGPLFLNVKKSRRFLQLIKKLLVNNLTEQRLPCSSVVILPKPCRRTLKTFWVSPVFSSMRNTWASHHSKGRKR